ncbi:efflux RND transporter periplasmic adaptor subunit [candidate division KSB1 bacterium]
MKKVVFAVLFAAVVFLVFKGVRASIERSKTEILTIEDIQVRDGVPVRVSPVVQKDLRTIRSFTGSIKGITQADAVSVIMEKVLDIKVSLGDKVKNGQHLITLDHRNTSAYRNISEALDDAKLDLKRTGELFKAGAVSQQIYDKALLRVKVAQADMDAAEWRQKIAAPIDGIVTDIFIRNGESVAPGIPLVRIAQLDKVITEIFVSESDISLIKNGQRSKIKISSYTDREFDGLVSRVALSTNPGARNFTVRIDILNPEHLLKPGMFASVDLIVGEKKNVTAVPANALIKENGTCYVYTVRPDNTVKKVSVIPGISEGEWIEISGDIKTDDTIVVEGHNKLSDGAKIVVVS